MFATIVLSLHRQTKKQRHGARVFRTISQLNTAKIARKSQTVPFSTKKTNMAKVTVEDILSIKKGHTRTFLLEKASECHNATALVSYVKKVKKPSDIDNYKTTTDWSANAITVMAL